MSVRRALRSANRRRAARTTVPDRLPKRAVFEKTLESALSCCYNTGAEIHFLRSPEMSDCPLRAPIVLIHGILGFDQLRVGDVKLGDYFRHVRKTLEEAGNTVLDPPRLSPASSIETRARDLKQYLDQHAELRQVHLIAHSMGNRAVANALRILSYETRESGPLFNEVILTAPDVDADVFRRDLAPLLAKTAKHVTLYASSNDEALLVSKKVHGHARAGETGYNLVVLPCLDTVDVSAVDTGLLGHSYYCESNSVLADMYDLIHGGVPADQRKWLHSKNKGELHYWVFNRE